jgi:hypothetical protein
MHVIKIHGQICEIMQDARKESLYAYSKRSSSTSAMLNDTGTIQIKYLVSAWKTPPILK